MICAPHLGRRDAFVSERVPRTAAGSARRNQSATPVKGQLTTADARKKKAPAIPISFVWTED